MIQLPLDSCTQSIYLFTGANSPGGNAHGRKVELPDWVLDYWHPLEKAQYPDYFARREKRKKVRRPQNEFYFYELNVIDRIFCRNIKYGGLNNMVNQMQPKTIIRRICLLNWKNSIKIYEIV